MPYEEDLNLFRNSNKSIDDEKFLSSLSLVYDRIKLRVGRSNKVIKKDVIDTENADA